MAVVEVVKYNGGPTVFAWKYPSEELGTWTQVIVNESQEAVLFKGGQALDVLGPGRHTLSTANIPLLSKLVNLPFGGRSPFAAEIWFINRVNSLNIKWGTPTPIQLQDPRYKVFVPVRSFGQFGIRIDETKKFLTTLVGTLPIFDESSITNYFRGVYLTKVRDAISTYLVSQDVGILEINAHVDELSEHLKQAIAPVLAEYGISLINFYVNDINIPEDDTAVIQLKQALAKRAEMEIVGYSYGQERSFDALEGAATNPGSPQAGLMGAGIGLGMGVGLGGAMGSQFSGIASNFDVSDSKKCAGCQTSLAANVRFCPACGRDAQQVEAVVGAPCGRCGEAVPEGSKFCPGCGESSVKSCSGCGTQIAGNPKFCPECGQSLTRSCESCGTRIEGSPKFCPECGHGLGS